MSDSDSDSNNPLELEAGDKTGDDERDKVRRDLSEMSFEDLLKLKERVGTKLYNKTLFSNSNEKIKKVKTSFKRANKNRPREMSSKKPVKLEFEMGTTKKKQVVARDPRFEPMCGTFDKEIFKDNYKFVNDIRKDEKKQLEKEFKKAKHPDEKEKLKLLIQRLGNQIREEESRKEKAKEESTKIEKPQYKKKSVQKLENLINKYEELKKTNKFQKHMERKSKKLATKERKHLKNQNLL